MATRKKIGLIGAGNIGGELARLSKEQRHEVERVATRFGAPVRNARRVAAKGYFGGSEGSALDAGFAVSRFFTNSGRMVSEFPIMFFAVNRDLPESARPRLTDTTRAEVQRLRKADSGICFDSHRLQRRGGATGVQNLQIHHRSHRVGRYRQGRNPQGLH